MQKLFDERQALDAALTTFDKENVQLNENVIKLQTQLACLEKENINKIDHLCDDQMRRMQDSLRRCVNEKSQVSHISIEYFLIMVSLPPIESPYL